MKSNTENPSGAMDGLKWFVAFALLAGAVIGNSLYSELSVVIRAASVIILVIFAGIIAAMTEKGKEAIRFAGESKMEVRKVVWPTRQETLQTTLIVIAVTVVMALVLWGIDGIMVRLVRLFTGM